MRFFPLTAMLLALAACGKPAEPPKAEVPPPPPLAAPRMEAPAAAPQTAAAPITRFKANGFSPAWTAEIDGNTLRFEVPDTAGPDSKPRSAKVGRLAYAKGINFDGKDGDVPFTLDINGKTCDRTGQAREFTATFSYGRHTYHGCADRVQ